ncbi:MAG: hypothetical protein RLZZ203_2187 [Cyanobacteriota bacterium]|jgi:hypothetical protein
MAGDSLDTGIIANMQIYPQNYQDIGVTFGLENIRRGEAFAPAISVF